jgi:uncharacterized protein YyaL (SSP411 family)
LRLDAIAQRLGIPESEAARRLASARAKLFAARECRVRPGRDDKILTSWNALMIGGLAHAARVFDRPDWLGSARRALEFIRSTLWRDGRLWATHKDGKTHLNAYLDDHAFLLAALLEMLQADFRDGDLAWAQALGDALLDSFQDADGGGFFFTSHDHEKLIHRPKPGHDNATPSGNGVAAWALNRLCHLSGDTRFQQAAEGTLSLFWPAIERRPAGFGSLLGALAETLQPPRIVIVNGAREDLRPWQEALRRDFLPDALVLFIDGDPARLPPPLAKPRSGHVNAWVCEGVTCLAPLREPVQLREILKPPKMTGSAPR